MIQGKLDGKFNFIGLDGNLMPKWWLNAYPFREGFAAVQRDDLKWSFIDEFGNMLTDEWFDCAYSFHKGFARVQRNGFWNLLNVMGKLVYKGRHLHVEEFEYGYSVIKNVHNQWNAYNKDGQLWGNWYDNEENFRRDFYDTLMADARRERIEQWKQRQQL